MAQLQECTQLPTHVYTFEMTNSRINGLLVAVVLAALAVATGAQQPASGIPASPAVIELNELTFAGRIRDGRVWFVVRYACLPLSLLLHCTGHRCCCCLHHHFTCTAICPGAISLPPCMCVWFRGRGGGVEGLGQRFLDDPTPRIQCHQVLIDVLAEHLPERSNRAFVPTGILC